MFNLIIDFPNFKRFALFLLLCLITALWTYRRSRKNLPANPWPFVILNFLLLVIWSGMVSIDSDEADNLHSIWMTAQGMVPFRDFWQCRSPLLSIILSPVMRLLKPGIFIFDLSRMLCAVILLAIIWLGWDIAKAAWKKDAKLPLYLLIISAAAIKAQFLWLRPDIFMLLFLFSGIRLSMMIPGGRMWPVFCAGLSFATAASFVPKQYFLYLLPLIVIFLYRDKRSFTRVIFYLSGFLIGILPIFLYLIREGILRDFFFWVFIFNGKMVIFKSIFPFVFIIASLWASLFTLRRYNRTKDTKLLIIFTAFCLSTASSFAGVAPVLSCGYYLSSWFILCAVLFCGSDIRQLKATFSSRMGASLVTGVFFVMLISTNFSIVYDQIRKGNDFKAAKASIGMLQKYIDKDACLGMIAAHPVFARDATRLYCYWQFHYLYYGEHYSESVKKDLIDSRIAESIIMAKPAIMLYWYIDKPLFEILLHCGVITNDDFKKLEAFCRNNYVLKTIGMTQYYIRRDKIKDGQ